uniref:Uncharacterized protein n=1 Tax=Amphimedon queenslandica TaxID=400682 RepID=A0A1X7T8Q1_AMPQE
MYTKKRKPTLKWHCTDRCKPLLESDISSIIEVRQYFDEPIKELRKHLDACHNFPNKHYISEGSVSHINCVWPVFLTHS